MGQPAADQVASWIARSRTWAAEASAHAGAPPPLTLVPSAPSQLNPAWQRAPSWAAAALLVAPEANTQAQSLQLAPTPGELAAAAAVQRSSRLAGRALWVLGDRALFFVHGTPYAHCEGLPHRQRDLLPLTLALLSPAGEPAGPAQASSGGSAAAATSTTAGLQQQVQAEAQRRTQATALFREIAADQRPGALRLLGYLLSHLFRWLFNGELYVDTGALQRLRALHLNEAQQEGAGSSSGASGGSVRGGEVDEERPRACLVYIPAHKSHLDYLLLSYVLFASGLPCPHIAAGANLSLPLVGRLLRACGAFFIRRSSRGAADSQLYKALLAAYVHALLRAGHSLEFFVEGGRTRDGRVNPPKLGLLRMVVDAVAAGDVQRPVFLVPTAMNYDALLEERSLAAQLAGAAKKSESLGGLASACWGIVSKALRSRWRRWALGLGAGGYSGRCTVAFGEPIPLQAWVQEQQGALQAGGSAARHAVAQLGEAVTAGIRRASVLPTAALLVGALFADCHLPPSSAAQLAAKRAEGKAAALCTGAAHEAPAGARASTVAGSGGSGGAREGTPVAAALAGMGWLAAELQHRGAAVMRLPRHPGSSSGTGSSSISSEQRAADMEGQHQEQLALHVAGMLADCCSVLCSGGSGGQAQVRLLLERGVQATLLQHSRLNQLLPWLAAEGLLVAALLGAAAQRGGGSGGGPGEAGGAAVSEAEVLDSAAWLRCMLAPEVDTALGPGALRSLRDFEPVLQRLLATGALERPAPGSLRLVDSGPGSSPQAAQRALFAAALLAPLLATYCEAARAMLAALVAAGRGGATSKELCAAAQAHVVALAAGSGSGSSSSDSSGHVSSRAAHLVVPSTALVQGALRSLTAVGALAPVAGTVGGLANGVAAAMAPAAPTAEGQTTAADALQAVVESEGEGSLPASSLESAASADGSSGSSGALDQEYGGEAGAAEEADVGEAGARAAGQAQPRTPAPTPTTSSLCLSTTAPAAAAAGAAAGAGESSSSGRRSFERRRQQRLAAAAAAEGRSSASASGSDSELDPAADSVAANLCRLDSPSPSPAGPPRAAAKRTAPAAVPSAAAALAAAPVLHAHQHAGDWVLGQPEPAVRQLADRLEAFICI